ncbi:MAG: hypothetical protein DME63_09300 [Verrucomicrobia bacterium]|nr:MAG: hypothetical protein DME63_09300 [Verrucomicrobiota bacterium]
MGSDLRRIKPRSARMCLVISALVLVGFVVAGYCCYAESPARKSAQIEYITPDGQFSPVNAARLAPRAPAAAFVDNDTVSCVLREGETTFIIQLPKNSPRDRFTFLNENAAACGELRIAVSDSPLPADSPKWTEVEGIIPFAHKRLFKLSMLGVDTKFVRLSFKVERQRRESARISDPFGSSVLAAAINSNFDRLHERGLDLSVATASVAALPAKQD